MQKDNNVWKRWDKDIFNECPDNEKDLAAFLILVRGN